jgi:hypothetical protein
MNFQNICIAQLRAAQLTGLSLGDLVINLKGEAANLGVTFSATPWLGGWPYAIPTDQETQFANNILLVKQTYRAWVKAGRPSPPAL